MYFPNAFRKVFLSDGTLANTGTSADLTAGKIGFFDYKTHANLSAAPTKGNPVVYLAQGSFHTSDKVGKFHGGYKESIKSKGINPKYVSKFHKITAIQAKNQIVEVAAIKQTAFECGATYYLRLDVKGSPALRTFNHNLYHTFDAYTGCCAGDCSAGCTGAPVDATTVLLAWADQINEHPFFKDFVKASVKAKDGSAVASATYVPAVEVAEIEALEPKLVLTAAYVDTKFGDCTFEVTDHYEMEPLYIYPSLVEESGEPCLIKPEVVITEAQAPVIAQGVGETVLRDYILSKEYEQEPYQRDRRIAEATGDVHLTSGINRTGLYDRYVIVHNVPRLNNSSSIFDNDQYALEIIVPTGTDMTAFTKLVSDLLALAGNGVTLESY